MRGNRAFTLIELLVVIAVIAIIAAIVFPVFAQTRGKARQAVCVSNFKQQALCVIMYTQDYDGIMPAAYFGYLTGKSPPDKLLGQFLQPYIKNLQIYDCPGDPATDLQRETVEQAYLPSPTNPVQLEYNLALRNDFAYNYQYLCPVVSTDGVYYFSAPVSEAQIQQPTDTIMATDSVWNRDAGGNPYGGGSGSLEPPCRYYTNGADSWPAQKNYAHFFTYGSWQPNQPLAWNLYGGVWPWHTDMVNVAYCDGHIRAKRIRDISAGCSVKDNWAGAIFDPNTYIWWPGTP